MARRPVRRGQAQQRDAQLRVRIADHGAQVRLAAVPLGDQLEAQQIAIERDRPVQVADRESGVQDPADAHGIPPADSLGGHAAVDKTHHSSQSLGTEDHPLLPEVQTWRVEYWDHGS